MTNILWISRHKMTPVQLEDLKRIYGECRLSAYTGTVSRIADILPYIQQCDVIAAVLTPELYVELLKAAGTRPVIRAVSKRVPTGKTIINANGSEEQEFCFSHAGWEQILKCEYETKAL